MNITFRPVVIEDCNMIRNWIKTNEFTRHWYYFDKIPRLSTLEKKINKKLKEPQTRANIILIDNFPIGYIQSYYMGSPSTPLSKIYPEVIPLMDKCITDLYNDGLMNTQSLHATMTGQGMVAKRTTALGDEFLSFIKRT